MKIRRVLFISLVFTLCVFFGGCGKQETDTSVESSGMNGNNNAGGQRNVTVSVNFSPYVSSLDGFFIAQDIAFYDEEGSIYYAEETVREDTIIAYSLIIPANVDVLYVSLPVQNDIEFMSDPIDILIEDGSITGNTYDNNLHLDAIEVVMNEGNEAYSVRYRWSNLSDYYAGSGEAYSGDFSSHVYQIGGNTTSMQDPYGSYIAYSVVDLNTADEDEAWELANNMSLCVNSVVRHVLLEEVEISSEDINIEILR